MATASWYVGLRGGGGAGGGGGATTGTGFAARVGGLTDFALTAAGADLAAFAGVRADDTSRRSAGTRFFAVRAGLRADVRDLATRRDFAMQRHSGETRQMATGTVANTVVDGQDPTA